VTEKQYRSTLATSTPMRIVPAGQLRIEPVQIRASASVWTTQFIESTGIPVQPERGLAQRKKPYDDS
jgi:hypothetical protein